MNYLFVHQNFPGQYYHLIRHVLRDPSAQVVFISQPNSNRVDRVRRVYYQAPKAENEAAHPNARDWETAARRAEAVARTAANLKRLGFTPDIIIGHHGWGELLDLVDIWPNVPILGYFEFYYATDGQDVGYDPEFPVGPERFSRIRAMNIINHMALALNQHGQTPTQWQFTRYPDWARGRIRVLPEGARLDVCKPDPNAAKREFALSGFKVSPKERLVTFVCRNLEPYRGFHTMMRALPRVLGERSDTRVILVGGDDVSYGARLSHGTWREYMLRELAGKFDESRVLFAGQIPYGDYISLLQRSDVHAYLSYPFVASWSLREALACGCQIVAADVEPVAEFVTDDVNGTLVPGLDHERVAEALLQALEDRRRAARLRKAARAYAEATLDMQVHLSATEAYVREIAGMPPAETPLAETGLAETAQSAPAKSAPPAPAARARATAPKRSRGG